MQQAKKKKKKKRKKRRGSLIQEAEHELESLVVHMPRFGRGKGKGQSKGQGKGKGKRTTPEKRATKDGAAKAKAKDARDGAESSERSS